MSGKSACLRQFKVGGCARRSTASRPLDIQYPHGNRRLFALRLRGRILFFLIPSRVSAKQTLVLKPQICKALS